MGQGETTSSQQTGARHFWLLLKNITLRNVLRDAESKEILNDKTIEKFLKYRQLKHPLKVVSTFFTF